PLLPVSVTVNVPRSVALVVPTRSVELRGAATGLADQDTIEPLGKPLTDSVTLPVKPPTDPTATLYAAVWPRLIVIDDGLADRVKPRARRVSASVAVRVIAPLVPVTVSW